MIIKKIVNDLIVLMCIFSDVWQADEKFCQPRKRTSIHEIYIYIYITYIYIYFLYIYFLRNTYIYIYTYIHIYIYNIYIYIFLSTAALGSSLNNVSLKVTGRKSFFCIFTSNHLSQNLWKLLKQVYNLVKLQAK